MQTDQKEESLTEPDKVKVEQKSERREDEKMKKRWRKGGNEWKKKKEERNFWKNKERERNGIVCLRSKVTTKMSLKSPSICESKLLLAIAKQTLV